MVNIIEETEGTEEDFEVGDHSGLEDTMQEVSSINPGWQRTRQGVLKMSLIWLQRMAMEIEVETKEAMGEEHIGLEDIMQEVSFINPG